MATVAQSDAPQRRVTLLPGESVAEAARKAIAFGVESLAHNQAAAEAGEAEPLHQFRVATRRLRASIELFSSAIYASQLKIFRRDLAWISGLAGAVRECDVSAALIEALAAKIDPNLAREIAPMIHELRVRRAAAHATLYELLASKRYLGLTARLSRPAIKKLADSRKLGAFAPQLLGAAVRTAMRFGNRLSDDAPAAIFHKLRVRIKRLRYSLEMMASLGAKRYRKSLARLEDLQELLGLYNDVSVCTAWLLAYAESAGAPPRTVLAAGALLQSLAVREAKLRRRCIRQWRRLERSEILGDTLEEIRRAGKLALKPAAPTQPDPPGDVRTGEPSSEGANRDVERALENGLKSRSAHSAADMTP